MTSFHSSWWLKKTPWYIHTHTHLHIYVYTRCSFFCDQTQELVHARQTLNHWATSSATLGMFFIHSSVVWHLGWFRSLAIVNRDAINTGVQVPLLHADLHSFRYVPRSDIAGSYGNSVFSFLRSPHNRKLIQQLISMVVALIHIPTNRV
jgi:hypothetical protein